MGKRNDDRIAERTVNRIAGHMEDAAAMWFLIGMDRETFLETAGRAYDFVRKWHIKNHNETATPSNGEEAGR